MLYEVNYQLYYHSIFLQLNHNSLYWLVFRLCIDFH